jgi:cytochrome c biogenesis protein CcdA
MGIGGVRGMLITLSSIAHNEVNWLMVFSFTAGVMLIFITFGYLIALINDNLLTSQKNVKRVFAAAGVISLVVGSSILF